MSDLKHKIKKKSGQGRPSSKEKEKINSKDEKSLKNKEHSKSHKSRKQEKTSSEKINKDQKTAQNEQNTSTPIISSSKIDFPPSDIDEILAISLNPNDKVSKFLVKMEEDSYLKVKWMTQQEIESYKNGKQVYDIFTSMSLRGKQPYFNSNFKIPEYLLYREGDEIFVKWKGLGFNYQTIEKAEQFTSFIKEQTKPKQSIDVNIKEPVYFFDLDDIFKPTVFKLAEIYQTLNSQKMTIKKYTSQNSKTNGQIPSEYFLVGGCGSVLRKQIYSFIDFLFNHVTNNMPILIVVEQRLLQIIESELYYSFRNSKIMVLSSEENEIANIRKHKCFDDFRFDFVLCASEASSKFNNEFKSIKFSVIVVDNTEIYGRSQKPLFQRTKINSVMKLTLCPYFLTIDKENIIESGLQPQLEEFTWRLALNQETQTKHDKIITKHSLQIFEKKKESKIEKIQKKLQEMILFNGNKFYKDTLKEIQTIFQQKTRKRPLKKVQKQVSSSNSKLFALLEIFKQCYENNYNMIFFSNSVEVTTLFQKFLEVLEIHFISVPSINNSRSEIIMLLEKYKKDLSTDSSSNLFIFTNQNRENSLIDISGMNIRYIVLFDPEYCPQFKTNDDQIDQTTIIRIITQSTLEVPLSGYGFSCGITKYSDMKPLALNDYASIFYWRPRREKKEIDYKDQDLKLFEENGKTTIAKQEIKQNNIKEYEIHTRKTDYVLNILQYPKEASFIPLLPAYAHTKDVKEILKNLNIYCYGHWKKLCNLTSSFSESHIKTIVALIFQHLIDRSNLYFPLLENFIKKENERLNVPHETKEKINGIVDSILPTAKDIRLKLKRIEKLLLISQVVLCASSVPDKIDLFLTKNDNLNEEEQFQIEKEFEETKPTDWWSIEDDKILIWKCWLFGYGTFPNLEMSTWTNEERVEHNILSERLKFLTCMIRENIEKYDNKNITMKPLFLEEPPKKPKTCWSSHEQNAIISQLLSFGTINEQLLASKPPLNKKNPEDILDFAGKILDASISSSTDPTIFCTRKMLDKIRDTKNLFDLAHEINVENMFTEDRILLETILKYGITNAHSAPCLEVHPDRPNQSNIRIFFEKIVRSAEYPSEDDCDSFTAEIPIPAGRDILVMSLGKIDLKPTFSNSDYIYPVGYSATTSFMGQPASCEITDNNGSPLFIVKSETTRKIYNGDNPDIPWKRFLKDSLKLKSYLLPTFSGHELFGFCCSDVLHSIQSMRGADKCPNYKIRFFKNPKKKNKILSTFNSIDQENFIYQPISFARWKFMSQPLPIEYNKPNKTNSQLKIQKAKEKNKTKEEETTNQKKDEISYDSTLTKDAILSLLLHLDDNDFDIEPDKNTPE